MAESPKFSQLKEVEIDERDVRFLTGSGEICNIITSHYIMSSVHLFCFADTVCLVFSFQTVSRWADKKDIY